MEDKLWDAMYRGNINEFQEALKEARGVDVNYQRPSYNNYSVLHNACWHDKKEFATLLLAHPEINVNLKDYFGASPFMVACINSSRGCAMLLLADDRVDLNQRNHNGNTPLSNAAGVGFIEVIQWWIASGREMYLGVAGDLRSDAIGVAKDREWTMMVDLLERFKEKPVQTKREVLKELVHFGEEAEVFAQVVFLCDGLLDLRDQRECGAFRFFQIARRLPMELQMILCCRLAGSSKDFVPSSEAEEAFRFLSRLYFSKVVEI